jgi:acyl-CoA hydrolase
MVAAAVLLPRDPDALPLLRRSPPADATVTGIFNLPARRGAPACGTRIGRLLPVALRRDPPLDDSAGRSDTALVMLFPPDASGMCSLGVQADFLRRFHWNVERIIGFINPALPRTRGEGGRSIVAVRARNAGNIPNGIVASLGQPGLATSGAADTDVAVTEFGVAEIRELPLDGGPGR